MEPEDQQLDDPQSDAPEPTCWDIGDKILGTLVVVALLGFLAYSGFTAYADSPKTISLSSAEKTKIVSLAERRHALDIKREQANADFAAENNRINEQYNALNIESEQLCFELKKAHSITPDGQYSLDEVNGRLVKVGK